MRFTGFRKKNNDTAERSDFCSKMDYCPIIERDDAQRANLPWATDNNKWRRNLVVSW